MLYDYTIIDVPNESNAYMIPAGQMLVFPFELTTNQVLLVEALHNLAGTQDHSIRIWISEQKGGQSLSRANNTAFWHPNRTPGENVFVYDQTRPQPLGAAIGLPPGHYFVNVLNLSNRQNGLSLRLTESN